MLRLAKMNVSETDTEKPTMAMTNASLSRTDTYLNGGMKGAGSDL